MPASVGSSSSSIRAIRNRRSFAALAGECTGLKTQIVERGDLTPLLVGTSCVLSCASSAGVEATLCGVPVIQLMPAGSLDLILSTDWGLLGTARTREELELLLDQARRRWAQGRVSPSQRFLPVSIPRPQPPLSMHCSR